MNTEILREFLLLSKTLNYRITAEQCFISQPTLSKHISQLEYFLGCQLFKRTTHGISLTSYGEAFRIDISSVVEQFDKAVDNVKNSLDSKRKHLRVGLLSMYFYSYVTEAMRIFNELYPLDILSINNYQVNEIINAFKNDDIDLALTAIFSNTTIESGWTFKELYTEGTALLLPSDHTLAQRDSVYMEELIPYPLVIPSIDRYPGPTLIIRELIKRTQKPANILFEISQFELSPVIVESGMALCFIPERGNVNKISSTTVLLADPELTIRVGLLWKSSNDSPSLKNFVRLIMECFHLNPPDK